MKNGIVLTILFGLMASLTTSLAQQVDSDQIAEFEARIGQTKQRLNLTDEQVAKIKPVLISRAEASMLVLEENGIDLTVPREQREQREQRERPGFRQMQAIAKELLAIREESAEEMAEILSEEQMQEYRKIQKESRAKLRERIRARASQDHGSLHSF